MINRILLTFFFITFFSCEKNSREKNGYYEIRGSNEIPKYIRYYNENGLVNGASISFNESGNVRSFTYLIDDSIINGPSFRLYDNGEINYMDTYLNGLREGISLHFNQRGILTRKSYYRNGVKDGEQYYFDYNSGDTLKIEYYLKGKLIDSLLKSD